MPTVSCKNPFCQFSQDGICNSKYIILNSEGRCVSIKIKDQPNRKPYIVTMALFFDK